MISATRQNTSLLLWQSLAALLRLGLMRFWLQALPDDNSLMKLLQQEINELLPVGINKDWESLLDQLQQKWPPKKSTLANFIEDFQLSLPDAFLLTLLGEMERSHLICLLVMQLQAPLNNPRPSVHLCSAITETLFISDTLNPLHLTEHILLQNGLIELIGDGPMPMRSLQLQPGFWSVLLEQARGWPHCHRLQKGDIKLLPDILREQLPTLCTLLKEGQTRGLILRGHPNSGRKLLAQQLAKLLHKQAFNIPLKLWQEQPGLALACRYAGWLPVLQPQLGPGEVWRPDSLHEDMPVLIILGSDGAVESDNLLELIMPLPAETQRRQLFAKHLGNKKLAADYAATALLSGPAIVTLADNARLLAKHQQQTLNRHHLIQARSQLGAERLRLLAQPVDRRIDSDAIILPELVEQELQHLIHRSQQRESMWRGLGITLQQTTTSGLRALFTGESGTGKTLAASYISSKLGSPLYRVDLSAVMNKYIGESEKNLSALLDCAAASDVILLFDEADSLFGQRSEGKETGERFANMLTHFLLTRIETHPGIVLLTSNNRERIDSAFTRRLDLIIEFPFPGFVQRLQLWHSHLGARGPGETVYKLLASYCDFSGGQLRNVVLTAAACANDEPISSRHLLTGLRAEYRKLGRELPGKLNQLASL